MSTPALGNATTPPRASLLGLPREIRDNVYSYLLTCHPLPDCKTKREVIVPAWCIRAKDPLSLHCGGLLSLMRTNRLLRYETTSHLYHRPTYAFTLHNPLASSSPNETDPNIAFLTSSPYNPARHIRRILIEADLPAPLLDDNDARGFTLLFDVSAKPSFCKCDVRVVEALASRATGLERLEIMYSRQGPCDSRREIAGKYFYPSLGLDRVRVKPYSWVDAPRREVPEKLEGYGIGDDEWPREEHRAMVEGIKRAVREAVEGGEGVVKAVERVMDEEPGFIATVWRTLRGVEKEKAFFAGTVMKLVEGLRGTLREVVVVGTVDQEWMKKVMELGVMVRAQDLDEEEGKWAVLKPGRGEENDF